MDRLDFSEPKPRRARPQKVAQRVQFQGERYVTRITQQGHLEHVEKLRPGRVIDPFWIGIKIPHLPEKTADESAQRQRDDRPPIAPFHLLKQMRAAQPTV